MNLIYIGIVIVLVLLFLTPDFIAPLLYHFGILKQTESTARTGIESLIGKEAVIVEDFNKQANDTRCTGRISISGELWHAYAENENSDSFSKGRRVKIVSKESTFLKVVPFT